MDVHLTERTQGVKQQEKTAVQTGRFWRDVSNGGHNTRWIKWRGRHVGEWIEMAFYGAFQSQAKAKIMLEAKQEHRHYKKQKQKTEGLV